MLILCFLSVLLEYKLYQGKDLIFFFSLFIYPKD